MASSKEEKPKERIEKSFPVLFHSPQIFVKFTGGSAWPFGEQDRQ
jgi:hypothetical protein